MNILLSMMLCVVTLYSNPVNNQGLVKEVMVGEVQIEETKKIVDPANTLSNCSTRNS